MTLPFSEPTAAWFNASFPAPTAVQARGWPVIAAGGHALLLAPTGSGKTLAAFLVGIDRCLALPPDAPAGVRVLYVSPLKALAYDVERNLRAPLAGVLQRAPGARRVRVDARTGDTAQAERRAFLRDPADVLVTTPESLYLLLTSQGRDALRTVHTVILDEIHALAPTKRGAHLALSLERLEALVEAPFQRVGLSATVRPIDEIAGFLGGPGRAVQVVDAAAPPRLDLRVCMPVEDMTRPVVADEGGARGTNSLWPALHPELLRLVQEHRSTLIFVNSRLLAERLCAALNELAGRPIAQAHHGSISHARRREIEDDLKAGRLPCLVATSSLELGIDMGAIDLVIQVESPGGAARGLQRVGRAGHQVGEVSVGRIFPKHRGDLLESIVVADRMIRGELEPIRAPTLCLDVLAQQIVAMVASEDGIDVPEVHARARRSWPYRELSRAALEATLDMLDGRFPSDGFADLRPRLSWDRATDQLRPRKGARMLAVLNAGTIPDRGLYGVFREDGARIGELDEEMVYETREGDALVLGASTWRVVRITRDQVIVAPAPGEPGRLPFWRGEGPGRPIEVGRSLGAFLREVTDRPEDERAAFVAARVPVEPAAIGNLLAYLDDQREATGRVPTDRTIVVECFRDEIGDWRVCVLSPFGGRVNAPWGMAVQRLLSDAAGFEVQVLWTDDGLVLRFADADELPDLDALFPDPDEVEDRVTEAVRDASIFAARFRENAGRALLLPRNRPGHRTPLWAQRRKGETLLAAASRFPSFPIVLETYREVLADVFDVPGLVGLLRDVRSGAVQVHRVETRQASPFSRGLVFAWVASYLYEVDAPLAERRAAALTLDRGLLRELLGQAELRDLLDPASVAEVEASLARLDPDRAARDPDEVHDLLRALGDLTEAEIGLRAATPDAVAGWLDGLARGGRAARVRIAGEERWIAAEDAGRYRDALGVVPPPGVPTAFLAPAAAPLDALLDRWARTHGPFLAAAPAARWGLPEGVVRALLDDRVGRGELVLGELRPGGTRREYCHPDVLRRLRRASLAALRHEVAAVDAPVFARHLVAWHGIGATPRSGLDALREAVARLEGLAIPFSALEAAILPARVGRYDGGMLDQLGAMGEVVWVGRGALGASDGRVALYRRDRVAALLPPPAAPPEGRIAEALLDHLDRRGASFLAELLAVAPGATAAEVVGALWELVWAGLVTNDTFQPLRALGAKPARGSATARLAGGRWGLVARLVVGEPSPTERIAAVGTALLDRYGVVARDMAKFEEIPGGFSELYRLYRALEESGRVRRGHFVDGLSGAQFAAPGAVDRLRASRSDGASALALSAVDPASPWGAVLAWPEATAAEARPRRVAGAVVVSVDGAPVVFVEKGGKSAWTFPCAPEALEAAARALAAPSGPLGRRAPRFERLDGGPARTAPAAAAFLRAGWVPEPTGIGAVR